MNGLTFAINDLERQRARIESALKVLRGLASAAGNGRRGTTMSPEGRARIAAAQKKRWAKVRAAKKAAMGKRSVSRKKAATPAKAPASA